jgi:phosphoribosylglycinamide formyltransferase-1
MAVTFVVLASGTGTNFTAIADAIANHEIPNAKILGLICNRTGAAVLERARERNIAATLLDSKKEGERYTELLLGELKQSSPDFVLLAGYMKILPPEIIRAFPNRIVNIHPSLLPSFPGLHAVEQALSHGVRFTGVTVHLVNESLDDGPILEQRVCEVKENDTAETLFARMRPLEYDAYRSAVKTLASQKLKVEGRKVLTFPR